MSPEQLLIIILAIVSIDFLYSQVLDYLNYKSRRPELSPEIADFYSQDKYEQSQEYQKVQTRFGFVTSTVSFVASFLLLSMGGFGYLDTLLRPLIDNSLILSLAYFGVLYLVSDILTLPFSLYSTFVIEEKFGFNKTTPGTFIMDKLKGYLLTIVVGGGLMALLIYLIQTVGSSFWLYFWLVAVLVILFVNIFYTSLILPLFNKLTPLEDGDLKSAITAYSRKVGFPLDNIYVIDGSKRSSKANAFFSGIGSRKKIVLYDTLIANHSIEELVAILAHEVGHFKKKHIVTGLVFSVIQVGLMLFIMSKLVFSTTTSVALGGEVMAIHLNLLAFGILYSPISTALGIIGNVISRKNEYEADDFARTTFDGLMLQQALKKLSVDNLSNLYPHKTYVFVHYSHPPLLKRLAALSK